MAVVLPVVLSTFGIVFVAELPDKTALISQQEMASSASTPRLTRSMIGPGTVVWRGAYFASHPDIQQATIRREDAAHPSTASLPDLWVPPMSGTTFGPIRATARIYVCWPVWTNQPILAEPWAIILLPGSTRMLVGPGGTPRAATPANPMRNRCFWRTCSAASSMPPAVAHNSQTIRPRAYDEPEAPARSSRSRRPQTRDAEETSGSGRAATGKRSCCSSRPRFRSMFGGTATAA
jgi:hypothetical protein